MKLSNGRNLGSPMVGLDPMSMSSEAHLCSAHKGDFNPPRIVLVAVHSLPLDLAIGTIFRNI